MHVFSASYASFLLAPLPAIIVAKLLGRPVIVNYRSGEAPDHLRRSWIARTALRRADLNVVPSRFLSEVFASFGIPAQIVANTIDLTRFSYRERRPIAPRLLSTRNFESLYNVSCTLRAFALVQAQLSRGLADARRQRLRGRRAEDPRRRAPPSQRHVRRRGDPIRDRPTLRGGRHLRADAVDRQHARVGRSKHSPPVFPSWPPMSAACRPSSPTACTGLLAPDNDAAGVAARIMNVIEQQDEARRRAAAARQTCEAYRWAVVREGWIAVYKSLLPRLPRARTVRAAAV